MKKKLSLMMGASLVGLMSLMMNALAAHASGGVDGDGLSRLFLICDNHLNPSISYRVEVVSGFFEVEGRRKWTTGADVYSVVHFTNKESLLKSVAVKADESYTHIQGEGFSLVQSGPGNINMKSFPATMTLDRAYGAELTVQLKCEAP